MKTKIALGSVGALAALAMLWFAVDRPGRPATDAANPNLGAPAVAVAPAGAGAANPAPEPGLRTEIAGAAEPLRIAVHLRGIDARAPWTTSVRVELEGFDAPAQTWRDATERIVPDASGTLVATLPDWGITAERLRLRLSGDDPDYLEFDQRTDGPLPDPREVTIDVQVVAVLTGRVVDQHGKGVPAARIAAFPVVGGEAQDGVRAQANSAADGSFVLQAPPDVSLQLVAAAMREASLSGMRMVSRHGAIGDVGEFVADLLPDTQRADGRVGVAAALPDFVLRPAPVVAGTVRWSSGKPVAKARVELRPRGGRTFGMGESVAVQQIGGLLAPLARQHCGDDGAFRLPAPAGVLVDVAVADVEGHRLFGSFSHLLPTAPATVDLELPLPIEIVAEHEGRRCGAAVELEGHGVSRMDDGDVLRLVTAAPLRVRARHDRLRSGWVALGPDDAGRTAVLAMHEVLTEVAVEFEGEFRVRNARFRWEPLAGGEAGTAAQYRDDRGDPFRLFLEPGRYRLRIEPSGGERNGLFLLPASLEIDVGAPDQRVTVPAVFGGTFALAVTDARGLHVAGHCRVRDAAGRDCTDRFCLRPRSSDARRGVAGELLAGGPNEFLRILPVGDYELELDLGAHGVQRRKVAIAAREVVEVRVRLP